MFYIPPARLYGDIQALLANLLLTDETENSEDRESGVGGKLKH